MRSFSRSLATALAFGLAAPALAVERGDLLVAVSEQSALWVIDPTTGDVELLAPPSGQTSLLADPGAVAVGSDDMIYVADRTTQRLVAIDPETGEQRVLGRTVIEPLGSHFEPVVTGAAPQGLDVANGLFGPELAWVAAEGLYSASAGFLGWSGSLGVPSAGLEMLDVAVDRGPIGVDRTWIAAGHPGLYFLDTGSTEPEKEVGFAAEIEVNGVAVSSEAEPSVYFVTAGSVAPDAGCFFSGTLYRVDPSGGLLIYSLNGQLAGIDLECLTEIAVAPGLPRRMYLVDHRFKDRTGHPRLFEVTLPEGQPRGERLISAYAGDTLAFHDVAVFAPEPKAGALAVAATVTLAAYRRSRRRSA